MEDFKIEKGKVYTGNKTKAISFPLGGIGTGCIGLSGNGRLIDWEIFNRPNKRSFNGFSHLAVKAEAEGRVIDARVLNGDMLPPYMGEPVRGGALHSGYGFGPESNTMAGMPHFKDSLFRGEFPMARMEFSDEKFPGTVGLTAFNPFIPLNDLDSGIPGAFFEIEVENSREYEISYTVCLSASNPVPEQKIANTYQEIKNIKLLTLSSSQYGANDLEFGDISIATDAENASCQEFWYRGGWCDNLEIFWRDFTRPGGLVNRRYDEEAPPSKRHKDMASLAAHINVPPKARGRARFIITWNFPNMYNFWNPEACGGDANAPVQGSRKVWKNYYSTVFESSAHSAVYALENWGRLFNGTVKFKDALFSSTLPGAVKEAVSSNLSVLKSATVLRLTDGSFYGFEGCIEDVGCCEGSCSHVWNYAYALPFLFPKLERSMRELDFKYNQREDGRMSFRLMLPPGRERVDFRACVDGQFGGVIKVYRDWKLCGDDEWLKANWDAVKKSIAYAWAGSNEDKWDADKDGVIEGRQHHTLDMELFGPNSWMNGFYLAALKAGAEMAEYLGEKETSEEYSSLFEKGKRWVDAELFNGEYYCQRVELEDRKLLEKYDQGVSLFGDDVIKAYWNDEAKEIKYQIGDGCAIDQVVAQWHAELCGLGEIFDGEQTRKALASLYKYNFKENIREVANPWRLFSLNDEGGLIICSWPPHKKRPAVPLTYSTETMTGFEYQAAAHMIREGLVEEGMNVVEAVRNRYDGEKRNPWNEMECGSNYARSMASYSLLLVFSGFEYNLAQGMIGFNPVQPVGGYFKAFWSLDSGWGTVEIRPERVEVNVLYGELSIREIRLNFIKDLKIEALTVGGKAREYKKSDGAVVLEDFARVMPDGPLTIKLGIG